MKLIIDNHFNRNAVDFWLIEDRGSETRFFNIVDNQIHVTT